jgi:hypothetical protein
MDLESFKKFQSTHDSIAKQMQQIANPMAGLQAAIDAATPTKSMQDALSSTIHSAKALAQLSSEMDHNNSERIRLAFEVQEQVARKNAREVQALEATIELLKVQKEQFEILKTLNANQTIQVEVLTKLNNQQVLSEKSATIREIKNTKLNESIRILTIVGILVAIAALFKS